MEIPASGGCSQSLAQMEIVSSPHVGATKGLSSSGVLYFQLIVLIAGTL